MADSAYNTELNRLLVTFRLSGGETGLCSFDLMGIHDVETMNEVKAELAKLDPSIFVYGEGWTASPACVVSNTLPFKASRRSSLNTATSFSFGAFTLIALWSSGSGGIAGGPALAVYEDGRI